MNSTNSLPLDQYIPVNYSKGMLAVPTFVERFKQTHVKVSSILRNEGTLQKALIRNHFVFDFYAKIVKKSSNICSIFLYLRIMSIWIQIFVRL